MKTLYVPKGKTLHYERLECQTIIVDGTLVVDGAVRAKRITGKGLLDAGSVYSPAVSVRDLDTVKVVCDLLAAEYPRCQADQGVRQRGRMVPPSPCGSVAV